MKTNTLRLVVPFQVDTNSYCIDASMVHTISQGTVCRWLDSPYEDGTVGTVELDGQDIPVFRLRIAFDCNATEVPEREHMIVVDTSRGCVGFLVDSVSRAMEIDTDDIYPLPALAKSALFRGVVPLNNSDASCQENAILISPCGILGLPDTEDLPIPQTHSADFGGAPRGRTGQLVLFAIPRVLIEDQVVSVGFSVTQVLEVMPQQRLIPIPLSDKSTGGLLPWRSHFVPVIDLPARLSLGSLPTSAMHRIAIVRSRSNELLAFHTSENIRTVRLPMESTNYHIDQLTDLSCVGASFVTNDGVLLLPIVEELLATAITPAMAAV